MRAGAVILATGACGRLGLPASGYLYGTYENPTNAGDGYAMAYHAGAELTGIECFQINPLIKDYNGPACAYVANPFGGCQVNRHGERFVDSDYRSGQMMSEFAAEVASERGPVYLKLSHLPEESVAALESIPHSTERPTRATFHAGRGHGYRTHDVEMHISEIGLRGGHSASGVRVDVHARTTVPGPYAAGDLACVPRNYMIGAFVFGDLAGEDASRQMAYRGELPPDQLAEAHELIYAPLRNPGGPPQPQVEYKLRRLVNDYVAPPKSGARLSLAVEAFERMRGDIATMGAHTPHELMRCAEVSFIRDCAEMAARSSRARTGSRWGLHHERTDHPLRDDEGWLHRLDLRKSASGALEFTARPVAPYLVPVAEYAPTGGPSRPLGEVRPEQVAAAGPRESAPRVDEGRGRSEVTGVSAARTAVSSASPRILELLALAEEQPELAALRPYLADPDPAVRRAAVAALTETAPPGTGPALAAGLADTDAGVRADAAASLRELVEVLPPEPALREPLVHGLAVADPVVRAAALDVLRALGLGDAELFARTLTDDAADAAVGIRLQAVPGLVSVDALSALEPGAVDAEAVAALGDAAWQMCKGAATALSSAAPGMGVPALARAVADPHADVRKAAVLALLPLAEQEPAAREALSSVRSDPDADVRAYAAKATA
ncbi:oxidoreductase [Streptomyces sp. PRh5]|nr:oxidoreductase [Streptomyces sp. PRh5]